MDLVGHRLVSAPIEERLAIGDSVAVWKGKEFRSVQRWIPDERKSPARHNDPQVEIFQYCKVFLIPRLDLQQVTPR